MRHRAGRRRGRERRGNEATRKADDLPYDSLTKGNDEEWGDTPISRLGPHWSLQIPPIYVTLPSFMAGDGQDTKDGTEGMNGGAIESMETRWRKLEDVGNEYDKWDRNYRYEKRLCNVSTKVGYSNGMKESTHRHTCTYKQDENGTKLSIGRDIKHERGEETWSEMELIKE